MTARRLDGRGAEDEGERAGDAATRAQTRAIARGDAAAFARFYDAWFDRCLALTAHFSGRDEAFCLDVVQDAMMKVATSMRPLSTRAQLGVWMQRVVHRTALDHLRREARRRAREERAVRQRHETQRALAGKDLELEEELAWLEARLAALEREERALIEKRFLEGQTLREVGAALGLSAHAVHGRIRRILERLRAAHAQRATRPCRRGRD